MNKCMYEGRIANDLILKNTNSGIKVLNFSISIKMRKKVLEGKDCDFLPCVAYADMAELIVKHVNKGCRVGLVCRNTSYDYVDKETGKTVYKTVSLVEEVYFLDYANGIEEQSASETK